MDYDIQPSKLFNGSLDHLLALLGHADIALDQDGVNAVLFGYLLGDLLGTVFAFVVVDRDVAGFCGELLAD